jgi:hypothetical protein
MLQKQQLASFRNSLADRLAFSSPLFLVRHSLKAHSKTLCCISLNELNTGQFERVLNLPRNFYGAT